MSEKGARTPPRVVFWFKLYSGFLCVLYLATAAFSVFLLQGDVSSLEMSPTVARIAGAVFLALSLLLSGACLLPLVLRPRPWLWVYDLVVICIGMTSVCTLPASLPLMIFWMKPETKAWFGRRI
jgi:hypothetical protein